MRYVCIFFEKKFQTRNINSNNQLKSLNILFPEQKVVHIFIWERVLLCWWYIPPCSFIDMLKIMHAMHHAQKWKLNGERENEVHCTDCYILNFISCNEWGNVLASAETVLHSIYNVQYIRRTVLHWEFDFHFNAEISPRNDEIQSTWFFCVSNFVFVYSYLNGFWDI